MTTMPIAAATTARIHRSLFAALPLCVGLLASVSCSGKPAPEPGTGASTPEPAASTATRLEAKQPHAEPGEHHHHEHQDMAGAEPSPDSLYQLQSALRDQDGHDIRLDHFRGHPVLIGMFYATCTSVCPLLVARVQALEGQLDAPTRESLRVLLVSLDPQRDDPAALKKLAITHATDVPHWRFAVGSEDATREIAAALGVRYRRMDDGEINHTPVIALLDPRGAIRSRTEGFGDATPLLEGITKLNE